MNFRPFLLNGWPAFPIWKVLAAAMIGLLSASTAVLGQNEPEPTVEHYRLEVVAFSLDYPKDDPQASNRQFGPGMLLNDAGQVLFTAYWRDFFGQQNTLNLWSAGGVKRIVTGGDLLPGSTDIKFAGGLGSRSGNFDNYAFNSDGDLWFVGGVVSTSTFPSPPPIPFGKGIFDGNGLDLIVASTGPYAPNPPVAEFLSLDPPYSGSGTKVYSPRTEFHTWLAENGTGFFQASLDAIEINEFGVQLANQIFTGGLFTVRGDFKELIAYPNGSAPGFNDFVFRSSLSPLFGLENGSFVSVASVSPRAETDQNKFSKVFYEYRDNLLRLLIKEGDPLPGLPPLSEIVGSTQPYDLRINLLAVDETGYAVFDAGASARNFIDARPLGFWKTSTNGLTNVFRYNQDAPTARGPVRFLPSTVSQRVVMRNGNVAFTTGFTGAGYAAPTPAIFRESTNGFDLVAAAGMTVPTTDWRLGNDFAVANIFMNKSNEVAFLAGFIDPSTNRLRRALWVEGRDRYIRRVCHAGQQIEVGGVKRTVTLVGPPPSINKDGVVAFFATFSDGTVAILRGLPPGYEEPREEGRDYYFTGKLGNRWYIEGGSPVPTNWEDSKGVTRPVTAGVAGMNLDEVTYIPHGVTVLMDNIRPRVGQLVIGESTLDIRNELTVEGPYEAKDANTKISGPLGRLLLRGGGNFGVMTLDDELAQEGFEEGASIVLLAPEGQERTYVAHKPFTHGRGLMHIGTGATLEFRQSDEHFERSSALTRILEIDGGNIVSKSGRPIGKTIRLLVLDWTDGTIGSTDERFFLELSRMDILPGKVQKRLAGTIRVGLALAPLPGAFQRDDIFLDGGTILMENAWTFAESSAVRKFLDRPGLFFVAPSAIVLVGNEESSRSINSRIDVFVDNRGLVRVAGPPESSLRLTDGVKQLAENTLTGGEWVVREANVLELRGQDIEVIGKECLVDLEARAELLNFRLKENAGHLTFRGYEYSTPQHVANTGTFLLWAGSKLAVNGSMTNDGKLEVDKQSQVTIGGDFTHQKEGKLKIDGLIKATGQLTIIGPVRGGGRIDGSVASTVSFEGPVEVGLSPGMLSIGGSMQFGSSASLAIELAGKETNKFDLLAVSGVATLNGTLAINLIENYRPAAGDSFVILQAASVAGQFANASHGQRIASIDGYGSMIVNYTPTNVVLTAFEPNPNPPPTAPAQLLSPSVGTRAAELTLTGSPGRDYLLQASTNLVDWLSVQTNAASLDGQLVFELSAATDPYRFYRALAK